MTFNVLPDFDNRGLRRTYIKDIKILSLHMARVALANLSRILNQVAGHCDVRVSKFAKVVDEGRRHQARAAQKHFVGVGLHHLVLFKSFYDFQIELDGLS